MTAILYVYAYRRGQTREKLFLTRSCSSEFMSKTCSRYVETRTKHLWPLTPVRENKGEFAWGTQTTSTAHTFKPGCRRCGGSAFGCCNHQCFFTRTSTNPGGCRRVGDRVVISVSTDIRVLLASRNRNFLLLDIVTKERNRLTPATMHSSCF